jgi:hypothetical protein
LVLVMSTLSARGSWIYACLVRTATTLTISLPAALRRSLAREAKRQGMTEGALVRRAVRNELWTGVVRRSRRVLVPKARAKGVCGDEDVFKIVS